LVGINISGLLYIGGYTGKNMFGLKADYRKMIHDLIGLFVKKHNAHVMLIPHVFGDVEDSENDVSACHKIFCETKADLQDHLHIIEDGYDHHELKALIGRCDFFLGSRMHACIAALSQCIPAVGLAYSRKFQGVFESVGVQDLVLDLRVHDENAILGLVDSLYQRGLEYHTRLQEKMPGVRSAVLSLFTNFENGSG
jgi:colanic acid/amylovoran biosynthesis protein